MEADDIDDMDFPLPQDDSSTVDALGMQLANTRLQQQQSSSLSMPHSPIDASPLLPQEQLPFEVMEKFKTYDLTFINIIRFILLSN